MSAINITDFENLIRSYLTTNLKEKFPLLDTSENSVLDDLHIKPAIASMQPLIERTNAVDLMNDLSNAESMSVAELNSIGKNNYGIERNSGVKATTTVSIYYTRVSDEDSIVIPLGTIFKDTSGLQFLTEQRYVFTPQEMQLRYDSSSMLYIVNVDVVAADVGEEYNVPANQITVFPKDLSSFIESVTNLNAVTNGTAMESNADYASRIGSFYVSMNLGTVPGYRQSILNIAGYLSDLKIVGYGDVDMTRDEVTVTVGGSPKTIHMGGKVDVYLKGSKYEQRVINVTINSGKLKLAAAYSKISAPSVVVTNTTQTGLTVSFTLTNESDVAYIVIDNTTGQSYSKTEVDTISVAYTADSVPTTEVFSCGLSDADLDIGFSNVISVVNATSPATVYTDPTHYSLLHKDLYGNTITSGSVYWQSSQERVALKFVDASVIENGTVASCIYTVNTTVSNVFSYYEVSENRSVTTDLLVREAKQHAVNVSILVGLSSGTTLDDTKRVQIQTAVKEQIGSIPIAGRLTESDIVSAIYANPTVMEFLAYVKLPFKALYTPANVSDPMADTHVSESYIQASSTEYIYLNKFAVEIVS